MNDIQYPSVKESNRIVVERWVDGGISLATETEARAIRLKKTEFDKKKLVYELSDNIKQIKMH